MVQFSTKVEDSHRTNVIRSFAMSSSKRRELVKRFSSVDNRAGRRRSKHKNVSDRKTRNETRVRLFRIILISSVACSKHKQSLSSCLSFSLFLCLPLSLYPHPSLIVFLSLCCNLTVNFPTVLAIYLSF